MQSLVKCWSHVFVFCHLVSRVGVVESVILSYASVPPTASDIAVKVLGLILGRDAHMLVLGPALRFFLFTPDSKVFLPHKERNLHVNCLSDR